jgi:hypothetical protein
LKCEFVAELDQAAAVFAGYFGDHGLRFGLCGAADDGNARLDDAGFFAGDQPERVA